MTDSVQAAIPTDPASDPSLSDLQLTDAPMADPTATTPPPALDTVAPSGAPGQSPLDVLDQILKDAQSKAKSQVDEKAAEEAVKVAAERDRQKKLDEDRVRQQLLGIAGVKDSPEYHKMKDMQQAEVDQKTEYDNKMDGMEIVQLEHKKI